MGLQLSTCIYLWDYSWVHVCLYGTTAEYMYVFVGLQLSTCMSLWDNSWMCLYGTTAEDVFMGPQRAQCVSTRLYGSWLCWGAEALWIHYEDRPTVWHVSSIHNHNSITKALKCDENLSCAYLETWHLVPPRSIHIKQGANCTQGLLFTSLYFNDWLLDYPLFPLRLLWSDHYPAAVDFFAKWEEKKSPSIELYWHSCKTSADLVQKCYLSIVIARRDNYV